MFKPNEGAFWVALDSVTIQVSAHRLNGGVGSEAPAPVGEDAQQQNQLVKESLRVHLSRPERIFDILYFPFERLPQFDVSQPRLRKTKPGSLGLEIAGENGASQLDGDADRVLTRISDKQQYCILSLNPTKLFPSKDGEKTWAQEALPLNADGRASIHVRRRKELGNYKNTGFSREYIFGSDEDKWKQSGYKTVRGFNARRQPGETKLRHMLCLDTPSGKVFLKWCTQCHLWKNFLEFQDDGGCQVSTFCGVCPTRQQRSREAQLLKRRNEREKKTTGDAGAGVGVVGEGVGEGEGGPEKAVEVTEVVPPEEAQVVAEAQ